jgi:hypothetical protein
VVGHHTMPSQSRLTASVTLDLRSELKKLMVIIGINLFSLRRAFQEFRANSNLLLQGSFVFLEHSLKKTLMNRLFGAFAKLQEATISFALSVRPRLSVQLAAGMIFTKSGIGIITETCRHFVILAKTGQK